MRNFFYFFVIASSFVLVSCDVDSKQMEQYWKEVEAAKSEKVVEEPKVITSTVIRVDRIICSGGYSSYSKTVILTDDGRSFSFRDSDNIGSVNVREGDLAQYSLYSDGKTELEGIAYAINK